MKLNWKYLFQLQNASVALNEHTNVDQLFFNSGVHDVQNRIPSFVERLRDGNKILDQAKIHLSKMTEDLDSSISTILSDDSSIGSLRWFLLPSEAKMTMMTNFSLESNTQWVKNPVFTPISNESVLLTDWKTYNNTENCSMIPPSVNIWRWFVVQNK